MKSVKILLLAALLSTLASAAAFAQSEADPRVKDALEAAGLKYTVNSSNNYKVVYRMDSDPDRSHLAFIVSKTSSYRDLEIREIWSVAAILAEYPEEETVHRLLAMNSTAKIGAWAIEESDGEVWIMYTVKVPSDLSPDELNDAIYFVAEVCDELEAELTGADEY